MDRTRKLYVKSCPEDLIFTFPCPLTEKQKVLFHFLVMIVGLMGFALHGLASVFEDAIALQDDNDQFV